MQRRNVGLVGLSAVVIGCLMALRHEQSSVILRALIAGCAAAVLSILIMMLRHNRKNPH